MATVNTPSTLTGYFKERYADKLVNLIPESAILTKMVPFQTGDKQLGNIFHSPVIVQAEQGITYSNTDGFTLNAPSTMATADAQIQGSAIALRSQIGYDAAARAVASGAAFGKTMDTIVDNMLENMTKRLEVGLLYGGSGLAVAASSANTNATTTVITITDAEWSSGIWSGMEGATLDLYNASSKINTNAALVVSAVDTANKKITVTGNSTDIAAVDTNIASNPNVDKLFFYGAFGVEAVGLKTILTNTGTLFNISATTYNLWRANSVTTTGTLTFSKILNALGTAVSRGLNEDVKVLVSPRTWANLMTDLAALRKFDDSYKSAEADTGFKTIKYYGQNGLVEVVSHIFVKDGDCFIVPDSRLLRIGSTDITFKTPGQTEDIFLQVANAAAYELRCYSNQAILLQTPARAVYISGFVNV